VVALAASEGDSDPGHRTVAVDDFYATRGRTIVVDVLANDLAMDAEQLSTILVSGPEGSLVVDEDGSYTYTAPRPFESGQFSYAASDGASGSEIAMVSIKFGRKHRSPHKVGKGNDLDDLDPRHPASHPERGFQNDHANIFHDQVPPPLGLDESVFNLALRDDSHWLFG
jgi:hypothetical protein